MSHEVFHGGSRQVQQITSSGQFGGLFGSCSRASAASHGDVVHVVVSPRPLSDYELNYELDAYPVAMELAGGDEDLADAIMNRDCPDASDVDGLDVQRLRGQLAARLGYTSIEMCDEHGTTWLCLPGCTISIAAEDAR